MRRQIYLDYNATQPMKPEVRDAMLVAMSGPANASSIHRLGQAARRAVENARRDVAAMIGANPSSIVFTSGATEANATALRGLSERRVLIGANEHPSVRDAHPESCTVPIDSNGIIDLMALDTMLDEADRPALVSVMLVNNETGVIQPVAEAARIAHRHSALLHSDAAQAPGRIAVDVDALGVDLLTLSAHKIGGPQGIGALYIRDGVNVTALLRGGGQEGRRRAGTDNVAAIVGFGAAAQLVAEDLAESARIAALRNDLEKTLHSIAVDLTIHGAGADRVGNTSCFGASGLSAETALIALDLAGIAVSSGAACSTGSVEPSRVLLAMGVSDQTAREAIRVSLGWATEPADIAHLVESWSIVYRRARAAIVGPVVQELSI